MVFLNEKLRINLCVFFTRGLVEKRRVQLGTKVYLFSRDKLIWER